MSSKIEISPWMNGIHSLAEALRSFRKLHEAHEDIFALKDSILRSHHALETLFKHLLYQENPVLLVDERKKIRDFLNGYEKWKKGEFATVLDELPTTNLVDTVIRLKQFGILHGLGQGEYEVFVDSLKKLTYYRNRLQHFALSANPDMIGRILGNALPRAIDVLEAIQSMHTMVIGSGFFPPIIPNPIRDDLTRLYPEAESTITLLRNEYDLLVRKTVEFFKGREFTDRDLRVEITDYGKVGAPPYFPEMKVEGFLNFQYDRSKLMELSFRPNIRRILEEPIYKASLQISPPTFTSGEKISDYGVSKGSIQLDAHIIIGRAGGSLVLPDAEEKTAVLKGVTVIMKAFLEYEAVALMTDYHYDCQKVLKANGDLSIKITAIPRGYQSEEVELVGQYESTLDEKNAPFRLHAFREPDGSLKENRSLEWNINTKGKVKFG